jgi:hypothetical protein
MAEDEKTESAPAALPYKTFKQRHPSYDAELWKIYRALYEGGEKMCQPEILRKLLPAHIGEEPQVYAKRLEFALYFPYAGQIIDFIIAAMSSDPITMVAEPVADSWYDDFYVDTSLAGGRKQTFEKLLRDQLATALICKRSWLLVDLPNVFDEEAPVNLKTQEEAGALDAYLVPVEPENVVDWEETDDGMIKWAILMRRVQCREGLTGNRNTIREEYTYFTPERWARYSIEWDSTKKPCPEDEDLCTLEEEGPHSFGRVPLLPMDLPSGLHAMGKIKQMAISHFNKRSALDWGEYRSLFQFMVAKLAPGDPLNAVTDDADRAVNQRIGHGRIMVLGDKDNLEWSGPDSAPFQIAMADLNNLRDEMHRVLHHMALSIDNSGAALQRSGDSKAQDSTATTVVLKAMGQILRDYAEEVMCLVSQAHGDGDKYTWTAKGLEEFDIQSVHGMLEEAATLDTIAIPSATFKRLYLYKVAKAALGGAVDDDDLVLIQDELEDNISNEDFDPIAQAQAMAEATGGIDGADDSAEKVPPVKAAKPPKDKATSATKAPKAPKVKPAGKKKA